MAELPSPAALRASSGSALRASLIYREKLRPPTTDCRAEQSADLENSLLPETRDTKWKQSALLSFSLACLFTQYMLLTFLVCPGCGIGGLISAGQAPFLPRVADEHGVSSSLVGLILASDAIATCIFSPVIGFLMTEARRRRFLMLGLGLVSASCLAMGFIPDHLEGGSMVPPFVVVRLLQGLGGAMVEISAYGQLLNTFAGQRGKVMAMSETCIGLGVIAGPPFGGVMYELGNGGEDFSLPCFVLAAFPFVLLPLAVVCMPGESTASDEQAELMSQSTQLEDTKPTKPFDRSVMLSSPFLITVVCVVLSSSALCFIDPVLAPYLQQQYGLSSGLAGVFFMIPGLVYILSAMATGSLVDTFGDSDTPNQEARLKRLGLIGFALLAISYLFMAPVFAKRTFENLGVLSAALVVMGIGVGLTILPTVSDMQSIAERHCGKADSTLTSKVAGLWGSAFGAGAALGPLVGGGLDTAVGMNWGAFAFAMVCCVGMMLNAYGVVAAKAREKQQKRLMSSSHDQ